MSISEFSSRQRGPAALLAGAVRSAREAAETFFAAQPDDDLVTTWGSRPSCGR
jgi:hypothetical protein